MPVWAPNAVEKLASTEMWSVTTRGRDLVHAHAAVFFGNLDGGEPQFRGLGDQPAHDAGLLGFHGIGGRRDLFAGELGGGGGDLALFVRSDLRG